MNVLILGSGAREHAIALSISKSSQLDTLYAMPGNPGMAAVATCIAGDIMDFDAVIAACKDNAIDLCIVGPEAPLCAGVVDALKRENIRAFGPHQEAAVLEGSKRFAKNFMLKHGIPAAKFRAFTDPLEARMSVDIFDFPVVIKADGLAAGKGVIIAETVEEARMAVDNMMIMNRFGDAGSEVVIEEYLTGIEASQICIVDNNTILALESSQDYKRALDGDEGLNTGGMGNYSPSRLFDDALKQRVASDILEPFLNGLKEDGLTYSGFIFIGLMIEDGAPKVIEFNVRFGDPEAESILVRLESDLLEVIDKAMDNKLEEVDLKWSDQHSVVVILTSGGYPEAYEKGKVITGLEGIKDAIVFHAGTAQKEGAIVTNGGRVLAVTALGDDLASARDKAYRATEAIAFDGKTFRTDIAK